MKVNYSKTISIIGGAGHVGFPLGIAFAEKKYQVTLIDNNKKNLQKIAYGISPFLEIGADQAVKRILKKKLFSFSTSLSSVIKCKFIIISIGTPIDSSLKPKLKEFLKLFKNLKKYINKKQIIIIRSSIYPGTFIKIRKILNPKNDNIFYCPERIVQGKSLIELPKLPQIISGINLKEYKNTSKIFSDISSKIIKTSVTEAELIKLFSNANRYINFAIANQFYLICKENGLDFSRVREIMRDGYARNLNLEKAGFTAGPCLLKDTMQLSAFYKKKFNLGYEAMRINESIPTFILNKLKKIKNIKYKKIGVLGLAFKAEIDDIRDSLSIKLVNMLKKNKFKYLCSDEYYNFKENVSKKILIKKSDIIIIGVPHKNYLKLKIPKNKILINIWDS
jgi:UDP-N-acetyl-D-mannosaminuronic acid dehydrogenase